jgi:hypothetical protein
MEAVIEAALVRKPKRRAKPKRAKQAKPATGKGTAKKKPLKKATKR